VGQYGENTVNNNGERLIEFCEQIELRILNGWFKQRTSTNIPCVSCKSIIDYIIVKQTTKASSPNVRAMKGESVEDHFLSMSVKILFKFGRQKAASIQYNLQSFDHNSFCFLYQLRLAGRLAEEASADKMYETVKEAIHKAAYESLGEREEVEDSEKIRYKSKWKIRKKHITNG